MPRPHHWLRPQTVPRGFLRFYILTLLSRGPQTGYSVIQRIDERTEGLWKPGPGTMYPLLKGLLKEGLVKAGGGSRASGKTYAITPRGSKELLERRRVLAGAGRREPVMLRLFADLLPGNVYVPMVVKRYRDGAEVLREKVSELSPDEKGPLLSELRLITESQLEWIDAALKPGRSPRAGAAKLGGRT